MKTNYLPTVIYRTGLTRGQIQQMWKKNDLKFNKQLPKQQQSLDGHWGPIAEFMNFASPLLKVIHREAVWKSVIFFPLPPSLILVSENVFGDSKCKNLLCEWNLVFLFFSAICPDLWSFFDRVDFTFLETCFEKNFFKCIFFCGCWQIWWHFKVLKSFPCSYLEERSKLAFSLRERIFGPIPLLLDRLL